MRPSAGRALLAAALCLAVTAVAVPSTASAAPEALPRAGARTPLAPHGLGAIPPTTRASASVFVARQGRQRLALPASVDLSAGTPAIGDQGQLGSCATWAIGYGILGWYSRTQPHAGAPFAPLSVYNQVDGGVDNGSRSSDIYAVLQRKGVVEQAVWTHGPTDYRSQPTSAEAANALAHRTSGGSYLFLGQSQGPAAMTAIETALAAGAPVAIGIPVYLPFEYLSPTEAVMTPAKATGAMLGGHMIAAYGYDSTGVKIANSWGTRWGKNGWATLSWDFVDRYAFEASTPGGFVSSSPAPSPVAAAPTVTDVSPRVAASTGGTTVVVKGANFVANSSALRADAGTLGVAVVSAVDPSRSYPATVTAVGSGQLSVKLPAVPAEGAYRVVVTTAGGSSADTSADDLTSVKAPAISVAPGTKVLAAKGGVVTLLGSGFGTTNASVSSGLVTAAVNGVRVNAAWVSDTVLSVPVPAGTPGQSASIVVTRQGVASAPLLVPYVASIASLSPAVGPSAGGTLVTVGGRGFAGASRWALTRTDGTVLAVLPVVTSLDKVSTGVLVSSDSKAVIRMPGAAGFLPVVVTFTPDQKAYPGAASAPTAGALFTYSDLG